MDEASIEETITEYRSQLSQIQSLLSTADELTKLELYDLEKDLTEMIKIAEESLLATKKKNLLATLDGDVEKSLDHKSGTSLMNNSVKSEDIVNNVDTSCDNEFDFVGMKCKVKYTQEWGTFQYHNAMILNCDIDDTLDDCQVKVHVLFLNPIHKSMVPCKYFLNGKCDYDATCKFSHGYVVDIEELEEYDEPDFTQLRKGCRCLAKYEDDGVWYPASVDSIQEDQATVTYDSYKETVDLDFHSILPVSSAHVSDDSSEEEGLVDWNDIDVAELSYKPVSMSGPMGDWEQHTKGIGTKLMLKMGYSLGKGLGKDGQGRVEPVEIRLLPPGKSLDHIAELREKGKIKDPIKSKKKTKSKSLTDNAESAFDIINKLTHKASGIGTSDEPCGSSTKFSIEDSYKSIKKHLKSKNRGDVNLGKRNNDTKLNVEMFKVSEKIIGLKKRLTLQQEALTRNPGDTPVSRRIKQNIDATRNEIDELQKIDKSLQDKLQMKKQSKKLTVF